MVLLRLNSKNTTLLVFLSLSLFWIIIIINHKEIICSIFTPIKIIILIIILVKVLKLLIVLSLVLITTNLVILLLLVLCSG